MKKLLSVFLLAFIFTFSSGFGLVTDSPAVHREMAKAKTISSLKNIEVAPTPKAAYEPAYNSDENEQKNTEPKQNLKDKIFAFFASVAQKFIIFLFGTINK